ncbi:hypothetical protein [Glutamicibacter creatinolyticus]|uniref:hypothetical protein n=1 Tax=Glutamicibacter creatinolyticus TaxID=162496 RepID=UPI003217D8CB
MTITTAPAAEAEETLIESYADFVTVHHDTVVKVAETVARSFKTVDAEDLAQDMWESLGKGWKKIIESSRSVRSVLFAVAKRIANEERIDYMHFTGSFLYTPDEVRDILESSAWVEVEKAPDVEGRADVTQKFEKLPSGQKAALFKRYALGVPSKDLTKSEKNAVFNGITNLTDRLNSGLRLAPMSLEATMENNPELLEGK